MASMPPEKKQAFGKAAKKHTSRLTYKKAATVTSCDTDSKVALWVG